jgi:hypothetical protein
MNNKFKNAAVIALLIIVAGASSCMASNKMDNVKVKTIKDSKARIAWSSVYQENGETVVRGVLRRSDKVGYPIMTHVDAAIVSADGKVVSQGRSAGVKVARRNIRRGHRSFERFEVRIPGKIAAGSVVQLTSHAGAH